VLKRKVYDFLKHDYQYLLNPELVSFEERIRVQRLRLEIQLDIKVNVLSLKHSSHWVKDRREESVSPNGWLKRFEISQSSFEVALGLCVDDLAR
jgi:hypothetical protein